MESARRKKKSRLARRADSSRAPRPASAAAAPADGANATPHVSLRHRWAIVLTLWIIASVAAFLFYHSYSLPGTPWQDRLALLAQSPLMIALAPARWTLFIPQPAAGVLSVGLFLSLSASAVRTAHRTAFGVLSGLLALLLYAGYTGCRAALFTGF